MYFKNFRIIIIFVFQVQPVFKGSRPDSPKIDGTRSKKLMFYTQCKPTPEPTKGSTIGNMEGKFYKNMLNIIARNSGHALDYNHMRYIITTCARL